MRGDLYVKVCLEVPTKLTAEQKRLIKQLDDSVDEEEAYQKKKSFAETMKELFSGENKTNALSQSKRKKKK